MKDLTFDLTIANWPNLAPILALALLPLAALTM
jgi:hypothetical protein